MSEHTCHARNCDVVVPRKMFMCRPHWYMLPRPMRVLVWYLYVPGQEGDMSKVTAGYLQHTALCIELVAKKEAANAADG